MAHINSIDILIVTAYLLICLALGVKKFGQIRTLREYTLGDKPFATWVLIATTFATVMGVNIVIGNVGQIYKLGITFGTTMFLLPVGFFIMARLLSNNINFFHKKKFLTIGDIMEHYYGKFGRTLLSLGAIVLTLGVIAAGSLGIGKLGYHFFGISELIGIALGLGVVTIYSAIGGFSAVAFTDVFQFLVFFSAIPIACFLGYREMDGFKNILQTLPPSHLTIEIKDLWIFFCTSMVLLLPAINIPYIQRALVAKNEYQLRKTFNATGLLMIPVFLLLILIGFMTYIKNPNLQPDTVLYYFMEHFLPTGVLGLMIAGVLAIIMSTQDSYLNATSTIISSDICKRIWPNLGVKHELLIARISCVLLSLGSTVLLFAKKDLTAIIWFAYNFWTPMIGVPLVLALAGIRIKKGLFVIIPAAALTSQIIARQFTTAFDEKTATIGIIAAAITILILNRINRTQHEIVN